MLSRPFKPFVGHIKRPLAIHCLENMEGSSSITEENGDESSMRLRKVGAN